MKNVKIISKTEAGEKAIRTHVDESHTRKNLLHSMAFKQMGYRQQLMLGPPVALLIEINNPAFQMLIKEKHFLSEIEDTMEENGAKKDIDYFFEVQK